MENTYWFQDQVYLEQLKDSPERAAWTEAAFEIFPKLTKKLPVELRVSNQVGTLVITEITGTEGLSTWMNPIQGHKKIIGPFNEIKLLDEKGTVLFEGKWSETSKDWIEAHPKFFIWIKPLRAQPHVKMPLSLRAKGFFRYLRHKKR